MPVSGFTAYLPVGLANAAIELRWADKGLSDTVNYTLDATNFLAAAGNDTIVGSSVTINASPATLTIGELTATATTLTWPISGGTLTNPVADYAITVQFATAGGLKIGKTIWLRVWPLSPNKTFSTDLIVVEGPPPSNDQIVSALQAVVEPLATSLAPTDEVLILSGNSFTAITWASLLAQIAAAIGSGEALGDSNNTLLLLL